MHRSVAALVFLVAPDDTVLQHFPEYADEVTLGRAFEGRRRV